MNLNLPSKSYIKTYEEKKKASNEVSELYESGLSFLSKVLGKLHGINSDQRYWEIILGLWLREISEKSTDLSRPVHKLHTIPQMKQQVSIKIFFLRCHLFCELVKIRTIH